MNNQIIFKSQSCCVRFALTCHCEIIHMYTPILPPDMDFTCKNSEGSQKSNREVICSTIFYFYFTFILLIADFCKKKKKKSVDFLWKLMRTHQK